MPVLDVHIARYTALREVFVVVGITTVIALLIALFGSLGIIAGRKYRECWDRQYACQVTVATELHEKRYSKGEWERQYENRVLMIDDKYREALRKQADSEDQTSEATSDD